MPYHKKRFLSYTIVILCFLTAYTCRLIHTNNSLIQALVDQSRTSIYLGMYCAWVIYLNKHVVYKRMRQCLTVIGCLMVFWFFLRTVKYHIFQDPLSTHICWYLYYFPMILIPTLGLNASFLLEEEHDKVKKRSIFLLFSAMLLIISVFTNDLHQQVFHFYLNPPYSDKNYSYGFFFFVIQGWIIFCLIAMDIILYSQKQNLRQKTFLASGNTWYYTSGMEHCKYSPGAYNQHHCGRSDCNLLSLYSCYLPKLHPLWSDSYQQPLL